MRDGSSAVHILHNSASTPRGAPFKAAWPQEKALSVSLPVGLFGVVRVTESTGPRRHTGDLVIQFAVGVR